MLANRCVSSAAACVVARQLGGTSKQNKQATTPAQRARSRLAAARRPRQHEHGGGSASEARGEALLLQRAREERVAVAHQASRRRSLASLASARCTRCVTLRGLRRRHAAVKRAAARGRPRAVAQRGPHAAATAAAELRSARTEARRVHAAPGKQRVRGLCRRRLQLRGPAAGLRCHNTAHAHAARGPAPAPHGGGGRGDEMMRRCTTRGRRAARTSHCWLGRRDGVRHAHV
jgi:hypothetical protein